jgi:hypothetical protein
MLRTPVEADELLATRVQDDYPVDLTATTQASVLPPTVVWRLPEQKPTPVTFVLNDKRDKVRLCLLLGWVLFVAFDVVTMETLGAKPGYLGAAFCLLAGALGGLYSSTRRRLESIEEVPPSPIGTWAGGPVRLRGSIVPSEEGLLVSPHSTVAAVWIRLATTVPRGGADVRLVETRSRDFFIEDEAGARVRIVPQDADVFAGETKLGSAEDSPPAFSYLSSWSIALNGVESMTESLLRPGDVVFVVGDVRLRDGELSLERPSIIATETVVADQARTSRWFWRLTVAGFGMGWALLIWSIAG